MNLAEFSVKNPILINALTILIILTGIMAVTRIEREAFPNLSYDVVTVRTDYRGASPDIIEKRITIPLEKELKEVDDIQEMGSISMEGLSLIVLKLEPDASDKSKIIDDIQRAANEADDLPIDLDNPPRVKELKTKDQPLVEISLSGNMSENRLRELALDLETELLDMSGVSSVSRKGIRDRQIWVEVDPDQLNKKNLPLEEIISAIAQHNINIPGGLSKQPDQEWIVRTSGEVDNKEQVGEIVLRGNEAGNLVQVKDVAKLSDQFEEQQEILRTDGTRAMNLLVIKKDSADAIRLMTSLEKVVAQYKKTAPAELQIAFVNDFSYYIKRRLNVLLTNGFIGAIFVFIPMVLFLSFRVALGALLGMGTALLSAIALMYFLGVTINLISMFGLIIVLGMLVDEDLVVSDNITRYLEEGYSHSEAAIKGATEVNRAIISTVVTTIIVFVPMLFMTGIFGKFIREIPKAVIITLSISIIEALVFLPSHLADLNRPSDDKNKSAWKKTDHHDRFERFKNAYKKTLAYCLNRPWTTVMVSFLITALSLFYAYSQMKFILFPAKGIEAFFVRAEAPVGTPLATTESMILPLEAIIANLPKNELDHYVTEVGIIQNDPNDPFTTRGSHVAQIQVFLTPESKRTRDADTITNALRNSLPQTSFSKISFDPVNAGPPVGKPVAVRVRGEDYEVLKEMSSIVEKTLLQTKHVSDVRSDYEAGKNELLIELDPRKVAMAGLNFTQVASTVRYAFDGARASVIRKSDDETDILVRLPEKIRYDQSALGQVMIRNKYGNLVRLDTLGVVTEKPGISAIKHFDSKRAITVTANVDQKQTTSSIVNQELQKKLTPLLGNRTGYSVSYTGEEKDTQESVDNLKKTFALAMLTVFFILLITFESLLQTIIVLFTVPFGLVGVIAGLGLAGEPFSFLTIIGIIGLTGIVVDGGTLLFVFINRLSQDGMPLREAILEGCSIRFRSIVLTTITTVVAVIPAAYGIGGNDPFISPMAMALNWGMAGSVFFTLYTIPCMLLVSERTLQSVKVALSPKKSNSGVSSQV